jgi:hypothetical protein
MSGAMSGAIGEVIFMLAACAACLWLGFQIGVSRSELRRKADVVELERRFKVVDCKVVESPGGDIFRGSDAA